MKVQALIFATFVAATLELVVCREIRLILGSNATPGQFPWIVSFQIDKAGNGTFQHFCAGSIVDNTHIVTAGHCVWNKGPGSFIVVAGALNKATVEATQQQVGVSKVTVHPQYTTNGSVGPYDIAVVELATALNFNQFVKAVALPTGSSSTLAQQGTYAGWGNTFGLSSVLNSTSQSSILQYSKSYTIPHALCALAFLPQTQSTTQLSTGLCTDAGPLQGTCQGDSGGPFTINNKTSGAPYLAGVVSWGFFICGDGHPQVVTDVYKFTNWIQSSISNL